MRLTIGRHAALAALLLALLSGCGGDDARTYNLAAFRSCMTDHGVQMIGVSEINAASPGTVASALAGRFPEAVVAVSSDTEDTALIYIGPAKYADEFQTVAGDVMPDENELSRTGNLVVMTSPHPTQGFVDDLDACRDTALET